MPYTPFVKERGRVITVDQAAFMQTQYAQAKADAEAGDWNLPGSGEVPVVTETEAGGAPATGTPSGKFFKDDGTWAAVPSGGVTNGDLHDHDGGDGAQIAYSTLGGLPTLGTAAAADIGTGTGDVAEGSHSHTGLVTNGDSHNHNGGDGAQIDHGHLSNAGAYTHANIDVHMGSADLHEACGFPDPVGVTLSFNNSTLELTITPSGADFYFFYNGIKYTKTGPQSIAIDNTPGIHFIYYNSSGVLSKSTPTAWDIQTTVQVATVYWDGSAGLIGNELHGLKMDRMTHDYLHHTIGTRYASGLETTFTDTTISVESGSWYDEDMKHSTVAPTTNVRVLYRNGSTWNWTAGQAKYYHEVANILQYDNAGTITDVDNNSYVAYWIYATNHADYPFISIMGQRQDTTIKNARANNQPELLTWGSMPFAEMKLIYRVIVQRSGTSEVYQEAQDYRSVSTVSTGSYTATDHGTLTGLGDPDHPASAITVVTSAFAGILASTDDTVQAALDKIDDHTHAGGSGDVVGPASAVDEQIARFNLATGKLIQASLATIDDSGSVNIPTGQAYKINNVALAASDVGAAPSAQGVTNGNSHDHNGGDGAAIDHVNLSNKGTTTHADIDTALGKLPKPYEAFRRTGTTRPRWYSMPLGCTALGVSGALTSGRFYAIPFVCPKDCTTDYLAINCTTLVAAGKVRLGIYEDSNGEPGAKLIDAGEADTSGTGVKTVACAQALTGGKLYWLVALSNSATHAFRAPALAGVVNVIGHDVAFPTTHITHFYAAQTYGALPANFPTVTQGTGIVFPLVYVRLSA